MNKVVIAIDSFKGCLTSEEAGNAVMKGVKAIFPDCETLLFPVADGGEGMLDILVSATKGKYRTLPAHGPLMEPMQGRYGISGDGQTALVEMAAVSGLPLIPEEKRNPMLTTTYGTGELIRDALEQGCRRFIVGIGGSATNDAGLGMLQALGFRFRDKQGNLLGTGGRILPQVASIDTSAVHPALKEARFTIACDVHNPFCGPDGAAYVFAPQKGADAGMVKELDAGMQALALVIRSATGKDISDIPGAGAAGGMGGGFLAFLNAGLKPGIRLMLDALDFGEKIKGADLVFTGEGRADRQTAMGKVPFGVLEEARKQHIPVIVLAGCIEDTEQMNRAGFQGVFSITPGPVSLEKAMEPEFAGENIRRLVTQICSVIRPLSGNTPASFLSNPIPDDVLLTYLE
ncbi:glycerate kinase [uncultured Parabacteroides sp.]|uniref:glycerate kinase family protein n=3 Tax=uncultured Parabacteroides sp. TaxID=512312 RepID=UPI00265A03A5|nr:glycerate kinase [uncultured Parabacteroides sp.]